MVTSITLASKSARRAQLMPLIGYPFRVFAQDIEEVFLENLSPEDNVKAVASAKAAGAAGKWPAGGGSVILSADTVVVLDGAVLGKPGSRSRAFEMLEGLSGKTHTVMTGVCLLGEERTEVFAARTSVSFCSMSGAEINSCLDEGGYLDKAGAYAIQGSCAKFITSINGDYYNVMGLPVSEVYSRLRKWG